MNRKVSICFESFAAGFYFIFFIFFLRMIVTRSTVLLLAQRRGSGAVKLTVHFSHTTRHEVSCFLHSQYVWNCRENISSASSAHGGHGGEIKLQKALNPRWFSGTHGGCELQLWSLSVALLKELAGHQLCHLKRHKPIVWDNIWLLFSSSFNLPVMCSMNQLTVWSGNCGKSRWYPIVWLIQPQIFCL